MDDIEFGQHAKLIRDNKVFDEMFLCWMGPEYEKRLSF